MRGQPWLRLLFVVLIFAALSVPVWRLTHPAPIAAAATPVAAESTPAPTTISLEVEVTFAGPPPTSFQLKEPGQTILQSGDVSGETTARATWHAHLPKEGVDLTFEAHWPDDAEQTAARIRVSFPTGQTVEKTFWARGAMAEILTVPASPGESPSP